MNTYSRNFADRNLRPVLSDADNGPVLIEMRYLQCPNKYVVTTEKEYYRILEQSVAYEDIKDELERLRSLARQNGFEFG